MILLGICFVYNTIKALKVKDHRTLPIYLQRLESHLFIDCIARELVDNGIVPFTIHDSVIVKTKDQDKAIEIMNDVFIKEIGEIPTYDIKKLKEHLVDLNGIFSIVPNS